LAFAGQTQSRELHHAILRPEAGPHIAARTIMLDRVTGFEHEIGIKFLVKRALVSSQGVAYALSLMLTLKYFAIVGAVLFAALWALAVHFEP
jgi:hypothetical protein